MRMALSSTMVVRGRKTMMLSQLVVQVGWEERTGGGAIGTDDDSDDKCAYNYWLAGWNWLRCLWWWVCVQLLIGLMELTEMFVVMLVTPGTGGYEVILLKRWWHKSKDSKQTNTMEQNRASTRISTSCWRWWQCMFNFQSVVMLLSITFLGRWCSEIDEDSTSLRADGDGDCLQIMCQIFIYEHCSQSQGKLSAWQVHLLTLC